MKRLNFILYDGILNSVFPSMVLTPLLNKLKSDADLDITLVSFERKPILQEKLISLIPSHNRLHVIIARRFYFFGRLSFIEKMQLKRLKLKGTVIARGPLAGYIAQSVFNKVTVQARGLAAEEFRYAKNLENPSFLKRILFKIIYYELRNIEKKVYGNATQTSLTQTGLTMIEAVSPELKKHIVKTFNANPNKITISKDDLIPAVKDNKRLFYRKEIRKELSIAENSFIYCYSGSFKPWQCIDETISFFKNNNTQNKFLLILTRDTKKFEEIIQLNKIPKSQYKVIEVNFHDIPNYLAACDAGLLLRKKDIVNWISRPTKMLEYQAAKLDIIHNNTIAYLNN